MKQHKQLFIIILINLFLIFGISMPSFSKEKFPTKVLQTKKTKPVQVSLKQRQPKPTIKKIRPTPKVRANSRLQSQKCYCNVGKITIPWITKESCDQKKGKFFRTRAMAQADIQKPKRLLALKTAPRRPALRVPSDTIKVPDGSNDGTFQYAPLQTPSRNVTDQIKPKEIQLGLNATGLEGDFDPAGGAADGIDPTKIPGGRGEAGRYGRLVVSGNDCLGITIAEYGGVHGDGGISYSAPGVTETYNHYFDRVGGNVSYDEYEIRAGIADEVRSISPTRSEAFEVMHIKRYQENGELSLTNYDLVTRSGFEMVYGIDDMDYGYYDDIGDSDGEDTSVMDFSSDSDDSDSDDSGDDDSDSDDSDSDDSGDDDSGDDTEDADNEEDDGGASGQRAEGRCSGGGVALGRSKAVAVDSSGNRLNTNDGSGGNHANGPTVNPGPEVLRVTEEPDLGAAPEESFELGIGAHYPMQVLPDAPGVGPNSTPSEVDVINAGVIFSGKHKKLTIQPDDPRVGGNLGQ